MVAFPYLISLNVQYPSGTSLSNINITCRIESTNESKTLTTNASGDVVFNLGNQPHFPSGFSIGDKVTLFALYQGFQQSFSFEVPTTSTTVKDDSGVIVGTAQAGSLSGTLILVAVPTTPSLRYFTGQEFLDYFGLKSKDKDAENGISMAQLTQVGESVEHDIDSDCQTKFDSNNGIYYSTTIFHGNESPEYHDSKSSNQNLFFTKYVPINSVSVVEVDKISEGGTANWTTLATTDYVVDNKTGRIKIINSSNYPAQGARKVRVTYTFGRSSVPKDIKMLAIIETGMKLMGINFLQNQIRDFEELKMPDMIHFSTYRNRIIKKYKNHYFNS